MGEIAGKFPRRDRNRPAMGERPSDELGRQVSEDERSLWNEVERRVASGPYPEIRTVEAGRQVGLHPSRARQLARTWGNDGLVQTMDNGNLIRLTEYGKRFSFGGSDE